MIKIGKYVYYSAKDLATEFKVDIRHINRLIKEKRLRAKVIGGVAFVTDRAVMDFFLKEDEPPKEGGQS